MSKPNTLKLSVSKLKELAEKIKQGKHNFLSKDKIVHNKQPSLPKEVQANHTSAGLAAPQKSSGIGIQAIKRRK